MPNTITDTITELADNKSDIQDALVAKGVTSAGKHGFNKFAEDIASITNQYTSLDEGKVVSGGELVTQTARPTEITANDTYDTTLINSVTVNVLTGGHEVVVTTLPNAVVTISDSSNTYTATANENGIASFTGVVAGTYTVTASIEGALIESTSLTVTDFTADLFSPIVTRQVDFTNNTSPVAPSAADLAASSVYSGITRCNVADDGTILAYYGESGYTEDGSNGQVMVKIPKFWYKLDAGSATSGGNIEIGQWYISDSQLDSSYKLHPAFINANGDEVDYFLIGAFENTFQNGSTYTASYNSSYKMASVGSNGGKSIKPGDTFKRPQGRACAALRGTGWYQIGFKQIQAVQMLFGVEFGFNSQYTVGQGYTYSGNTATTYVGQTTNVTSGYTTTGGGTAGDMKPVCWRGIENLWGNSYSWIDGFIGNNGTGYFKNDYNFDDTYSSSTYTQIGFTLSSSGYSTYFGYDSTNDWIIFPHSTSSSTSNPTGPIGDYFYLNTSTNRLCSLGGRWDGGTNAGLFCFYVHYGSAVSPSDIGSRLMYVPTTI